MALTCIPFLEDLVEANETTWMFLAVAIVAWRQDDVRNGVPLGIVMALFAKPQLLPIFLWMALWRRRALAGTIVAGAVVTIAAALAAGAASYADWLRYGASQVNVASQPFAGNEGLAVIVGSWMPLVVLALLGMLALALWYLDEDRALLWALATGVLILPYAAGLSLMPLLAAWRRLGQAGPLAGLAAVPLSLFAPMVLLFGALAAQVVGIGSVRRDRVGSRATRVAGAVSSSP